MQCPICKKNLILNKNDNSNCMSYICENKHSYDVSKYGYVNLLKASKTSGDNKEMVLSRHEFLKAGYFDKLAFSIKEIVNDLKVKNILDLGCGEGYYDRVFASEDYTIMGMDISKEAVLMASKAKALNCMYVVGNSFHIPFMDNYFDLILSIFAPIEEDEVIRVGNKYLIKVIPNENHLLELKEELYKDVYKSSILDSKIKGYSLIKEKYLNYKEYVKDIQDLFKMTPYFYTTHNNFSLNLIPKDITFDFIIRIYQKEEI